MGFGQIFLHVRWMARNDPGGPREVFGGLGLVGFLYASSFSDRMYVPLWCGMVLVVTRVLRLLPQLPNYEI